MPEQRADGITMVRRKRSGGVHVLCVAAESIPGGNDGSALFLLDAAKELLYILEDPIRAQVRLRNNFEMDFDGMA